ncbi:hypothetical protein CUMW_255400, partial [Citrus unshiu]
MGQYFPLSVLLLFFINGQSSISSCKSDLGRPCFEKYLSFGQLSRSRNSNEVRFSPIEDRRSRLGISEILSWIREAGNRGDDTRSGHPPLIRNSLREANLCNPHSSNRFDIFRSSTSRDWRLVGKPSSGNDTTLGHRRICKFRREVRLCMQLGKAFRFSQSHIVSSV